MESIFVDIKTIPKSNLLKYQNIYISLRQGQIDHLITAYPPGISDLPDSSPFSDPRQFVTSLFSALIGGTLNSQSVR